MSKTSSTKKNLVKGGTTGAGLTGLGLGGAKLLGYGAVTHSSGGAIVTVGGKYAAGTLGGVLAGVLSAPAWAVLAGGAAVGGLGYLAYNKYKGKSETQNEETPDP